MTDYTPQRGDIGLTSISGSVGALIRFGQWLNGDGFTRYEHAFVFTGEGIVEAMPGGALYSRLAKYPAGSVAWLRCPPETGSAVATSALMYVGVPYSFLDYAALAAHRFRLPVPGLRRYIRDTGHMICSQLADQAAANGGWHLYADDRWPGYVTPGALDRLVAVQQQTDPEELPPPVDPSP